MDLNKFTVGNYHCVSHRSRDENSFSNQKDNYVETLGSRILIHEAFKDSKGYNVPLNIVNSHFSEDYMKEYSIEISEGYNFFVRELFCRYSNSYWYETYLNRKYIAKDWRENSLFSLDDILFNVTINDERKTDNGYSDGNCLNKSLSKEDLIKIYEKAFEKNVFELIVMSVPNDFKNVFKMGQEDIKDRFKDLMGIHSW